MMLSSKEAIANIMNVTTMDNEHAAERFKQNYTECIKRYPKMRYCIKFIAGDPYYHEMNVEEAVAKTFIGPDSDEKVLRS